MWKNQPACSVAEGTRAETGLAYNDGVEAGGLPRGDVARTVVEEHLPWTHAERSSRLTMTMAAAMNRRNAKENQCFFFA